MRGALSPHVYISVPPALVAEPNRRGNRPFLVNVTMPSFAMRHGELTGGPCPNDEKNITPRSARMPTTRQRPPAPETAASKPARKRERFMLVQRYQV
jgi:hypothetical protein